jgi:hypothetical protein
MTKNSSLLLICGRICLLKIKRHRYQISGITFLGYTQKSKDWKAKQFKRFLGARKPKTINKLTKVGYGYPCCWLLTKLEISVSSSKYNTE